MMSVRPSVCLSVCLSVHLSVCPSFKILVKPLVIYIVPYPLTVGGRALNAPPPLRFFLSHFLCVKDIEPKLREFSSMGITHN